MKSKKINSVICSALMLIFIQLFSAQPSLSADPVEPPRHCKQCGMDRESYASSRMQIVYTDGFIAGVCSLQCAVAEMHQNGDKQVKSLMVADYKTHVLIEAKDATWVVGGKVSGVMTPVGKWAFSREKDATEFIKENGGEIKTFDLTIKMAEEENAKKSGMGEGHHSHTGHGSVHMHMGPGSQMLFNPGFGDDIYHTHPAGMWMVTYKFMRMNMDGLRAGTSDVDLDDIGFKRNKQYEYMMIPTGMTMDMHMLMLMYGVTDRLTVMAMASYLDNEMEMLMDMGPGKMITREDPMSTSGLGDTELRGIYKINKQLVGSLGLSLPTGDINQKVTMMRKEYQAPYDMQLGSGSFDLKPSLTYSDISEDARWNWGAQGTYTFHTADNENDYRLGDSLKVTGWLQRAFGPATSWLRLAFSSSGKIKGQDPEIDKLNHPVTGMGAPTPDADPENYGGQRLDGLIGISYSKGAFSLGVEAGVPLYQDLNGIQMKNKWVLNFGMQVMF